MLHQAGRHHLRRRGSGIVAAEGLSQKRIKKYKSNLKSILRFVAWDGFKLNGASQEDLKKLVSKINNHDRYSDLRTQYSHSEVLFIMIEKEKR